MIEVLRFLLFFVTTAVLVKVAEDVFLHWEKDGQPKDKEKTKGETFTDKDTKDDLTKLDGINERMVTVLKDGGVITYSDLELADSDEIKSIIGTSFPDVSESEIKLWIKQASLAEQERWEDLDRLIKIMKNARTKRSL